MSVRNMSQKALATFFYFLCLMRSFLFAADDLQSLIDNHNSKEPLEITQTYRLSKTITINKSITIKGKTIEDDPPLKIISAKNQPAFLIHSSGVKIQDCTIQAFQSPGQSNTLTSTSTGPLIQIRSPYSVQDAQKVASSDDNVPYDVTISNVTLDYAQIGVDIQGSCSIQKTKFFCVSSLSDTATAVKADLRPGRLQISDCLFDDQGSNTAAYTACDITVHEGPSSICIQGNDQSNDWSAGACKNGIQIHIPSKKPQDLSLTISGISNIIAKQYPIAFFLPDEDGLKQFQYLGIHDNKYGGTYTFASNAWIYFLSEDGKPLTPKLFHKNGLDIHSNTLPHHQGEFVLYYKKSEKNLPPVLLYNNHPIEENPTDPTKTQPALTQTQVEIVVQSTLQRFPSHDTPVTVISNKSPSKDVIVSGTGPHAPPSPLKKDESHTSFALGKTTLRAFRRNTHLSPEHRNQPAGEPVHINIHDPHTIRYQP